MSIHCPLCIASILCFSVWYRLNFFQGYVELLLVTAIGTFKFFLTIFAHSTTPIIEVCLEPLSANCALWCEKLGQPNGLTLCYTQSRSVETRSSSNIVLSCFHFFPILLNLMQKTDYFVPILGPLWPYVARFFASNSAKLESPRY